MQAFIVLAAFSLAFSAKPALADTNNCPGVLHVDGPSSTACCVGATPQSVLLSSCPGWPICTGPATTSQTISPLSCATDIPLTADNYDSLMASASSSLKESGTNIRTTLGQNTIESNPTTTPVPPSGTAGPGSPSGSSVGVSTNGGAMLVGSAAVVGSGLLAFFAMI
ncbi:uncharacterized protein BDZ99DRAFT_566399 [Mytilinidion resinicola]|uniref:Extracellular membrane protein CFEM domain-containing protein n=1 Tax=Mytilinidion resinicola TaxID=574789 RepID=A0A6A6Z8Q2_9PEZI|nr:uncharacterized protein BDZ99DRAFT_566399 [Mytilinidion resinicola]KAF2816587.1 hypothetical protein BDZ99DRAFT_566399 [Mytilinidion resinicola]